MASLAMPKSVILARPSAGAMVLGGGLGDLLERPERVFGGQPLAPAQLLESLPFDELHHDEGGLGLLVFAEVEDGDRAAVGELAGGLRLAEEALAVLFLVGGADAGDGDGFQGDDAVDLGVAGAVDRAHGPPAELGDDFVAPQAFHGRCEPAAGAAGGPPLSS